MNPLILAILAAVCVAAAGFALVPSILGNSARADKRIKAMHGDVRANRATAEVARTRDTRRKELQQTLKAQTAAIEKKKKSIPLGDRLYQAGMKLKPAGFIRNSIILGAGVFVVTFILQLELIYCLVFAIAGGYLLPRMYVGRRRKKYQNAFLDELPNAVEAIVRGVKSGLPLNDSMRLVAREAKEPIKSDFQRVLDQQSVGKTIQEAVVTLYDRVPVPEVNFFVVVITVQAQSGGNLSEALGNLARVLRNRKKMKEKVKAMSSEAKASAGIIGSLPIIVAILVSLTTPTYLLPMIETPIGNLLLGVAAILMFMGGFIMNRMVQFEV
ncbi:type II secretion system F family protein [Devosia sp. ZB163]|uniref:type II secretion system F family protein n=1 Tax=Devosia sp. ZB163 TaxID=3025938 RepID=UPI0023606743|nr:type II secretion system F family protein [Devosia sp. ZB163]MDC9823229.1 type II secretion system F family protein [Devosia sp. ZB163]